MERAISDNVGAAGAEKGLWGQEYRAGAASLISAIRLCGIDHNRRPYLRSPQASELSRCESVFLSELLKAMDMVEVSDDDRPEAAFGGEDFIVSAIQRFVLYTQSESSSLHQ
jgi:hypothetical protein